MKTARQMISGHSRDTMVKTSRPYSLMSFRHSAELDKEESRCNRSFIPHRYCLAVFTALGLLIVVGCRTCFSLVMTHVTSGSNVSQIVEDVIFSDCTAFNSSRDIHVDMGGDTMFLLHAAYASGLTVIKLPGSVLSTVFSPKRVACGSVLLSSLLTLITPHVIPVSTSLLFLLRTVQGMVEALQQPAQMGMLSAWTTATDSARLTSIFMTGCVIAPTIASLITGSVLCYVGWDIIFYIYGALAFSWCVFWILKFYDTPDQHPSLSAEEREHHRADGSTVRNSSARVMKSIPWRKLLTCPSVWAVFLGSFSRNLIFFLMVFEQPQYFRDAFKLKTADIGLISTMPYVGLSITCPLGGVLSDKLLQCGFSKTCTRKFAYTFGHGIETLSLMGLYFTTGWRTAITLFSIGISFGGFAYSGYLPLPSDIAPQYASVITGFAMIGTVGAVFSTLLASFMTGVSRTLSDWQQLFLITGMVHFVNVIIFDLIAKAELQPWATIPPQNMSSPEGRERKYVARIIDSADGYQETPLLSDDSQPREAKQISQYGATAYGNTKYGATDCGKDKTYGVLRIEGW